MGLYYLFEKTSIVKVPFWTLECDSISYYFQNFDKPYKQISP